MRPSGAMERSCKKGSRPTSAAVADVGTGAEALAVPPYLVLLKRTRSFPIFSPERHFARSASPGLHDPRLAALADDDRLLSPSSRVIQLRSILPKRTDAVKRHFPYLSFIWAARRQNIKHHKHLTVRTLPMRIRFGHMALQIKFAVRFVLPFRITAASDAGRITPTKGEYGM